MLKQAFNALTSLHSRAATLSRPGSISTSIRITPSNYFRFLEGPSSTTVHGREFLIPIDTMLGFPIESVTFGTPAPTAGTYKLGNTDGNSDFIQYDGNATAVQSAIREIEGYEDVTVTGSVSDGFLISFINVVTPLVLELKESTLEDLDLFTGIFTGQYVKWNPIIKRGDRIIDSIYGVMAIDEIIEVVDLGGAIMGWRVRVE